MGIKLLDFILELRKEIRVLKESEKIKKDEEFKDFLKVIMKIAKNKPSPSRN